MRLLSESTKGSPPRKRRRAFSDSEKERHADIVTIIAQANGKATLILENLLTRAADTGEDSWIDRFTASTYDDLLEETGLSLSKAEKELDKRYYGESLQGRIHADPAVHGR